MLLASALQRYINTLLVDEKPFARGGKKMANVSCTNRLLSQVTALSFFPFYF